MHYFQVYFYLSTLNMLVLTMVIDYIIDEIT